METIVTSLKFKTSQNYKKKYPLNLTKAKISLNERISQRGRREEKRREEKKKQPYCLALATDLTMDNITLTIRKINDQQNKAMDKNFIAVHDSRN